ncbi:MAG: transcription elongation factor GreA [Pseudomonadota bacterium]|uniref:transcription elongation factor GreA n=1 Tax=Phenylobacterium sp. TaxID=1871053 RepID=UPI0027205C16|nr:transcription elongation factor GreA [Phenylobacterium sp.]MDO8378386.1 transcription elongation factor GreA [Phenylobacterium sp.]
MEKVPMTVEGYQALDEDLKRLKTLERPAVIAAISEARQHGDLSENAEYHAAKERQGWIEGQIADIEDRMARAQVIDVSKLSGTQVKFGATVSVVDEDTEDSARYQIVGEHEADVKSGKISIASPIARAMIGKEMGDVVEVNTPGGTKAYEILKVEWV